MKRFVVVSGLPASGKSTLGRALAAAWGLPFIDKDEILEALFEREVTGGRDRTGGTSGTSGTSGTGSTSGTRDAPGRQRLSQATDAAFAHQAQASGGAVLASWWRHPLSSAATGTPTAWLRRLPGSTMEVHCECSAATAVARFMARLRHPGHLDGRWSAGDLLAHFEQQAAFGALGVAPVMRVETGGPLVEPTADTAARAFITGAFVKGELITGSVVTSPVVAGSFVASPFVTGPFVTSVSADPAHGFSKPRLPRIELLHGLGVSGDAHCGVTVQHRSRVAQDPTQPNLRQVHLVQAELFDELAIAGFSVQPGDMGENITTRGIALLDLPAGARLHLGRTAVVEVTGLRNPCVQLDRFRPGLMAAVLGRAADGSVLRKAGVMAVVVAGGAVRPGDAVAVALPAQPHRRLERV